MNTRSTLLHKELQPFKPLQFLQIYSKIQPIHGKETNHGGNHDGRISHGRRDSSNAQDIVRHCSAYAQRERNARLQVQRFLEGNPSRLRVLAGKTEEYPRRPEINKASTCWQWTINDFTAVRLLLKAWNLERSSLWSDLPFFSIASCLRTSQGYATGGYTKGWCTHE